MGAQCSGEGVPTQLAGNDTEEVFGRPGGSSSHFCGGRGRAASIEDVDNSTPSFDSTAPEFNTALDDGGSSWGTTPDGPGEGGASSRSWTPFAARSRCYEEEFQLEFRLPPPCEDDCPDRITDQEWGAMMEAMHTYIAPLAGGSSASEAPVQPAAERGAPDHFCYEMEREAAFGALRDGRPLYTLPEALRGDKEIVLAAIGAEGQYCYDYIASKELRESDRDVVMALVAADGSLLERCSDEIRADRQIVRSALKSCSEALGWAAAALQKDRELKAIAAARAKEEQTRLKRFMAKACGPDVTARCRP